MILDVNFPCDGNRLGDALVGLWKRTGDQIRDMNALLDRFGFDASDSEVGGFGSVHLYVARKPA